MNKIESFIKRNRRRNKHLWEEDKKEGYDFIVCPVTKARLSMIKSSYIERTLEMSMEEFDRRYPDQQKTCKKRIENISDGLKSIDEETGLTKHQLSIHNSNRYITGMVSKNGKKEYLRKYRRLKARYRSYGYKLSWLEETRESKEGYLEVRCDYCGKWFSPTNMEVQNRLFTSKTSYHGEKRLYCSSECKSLCPIFNQQWHYKGNEKKNTREVQPQLRQMVFERDEYTCQKCSRGDYLHCHHINPVSIDPIESADIDNCITLCKECHKEVHRQDGCKYRELLNVC